MVDALRSEEVFRCSLISAAEKNHIRATVDVPMSAGPHFRWDRAILFNQAFNIHRHWKLKE
jgi:hypothetical protein